MNKTAKHPGLAFSAALVSAAVLYQLVQTSSVQAQSAARGGGYGGGVQQGSGSRAQTQARPAADRPFEDRLWDWLQSAQYRHWTPMPGQSADFLPARSPHGEYVKVYVNRTGVGSADAPASGSLLVKEGFAADRRTLQEITVMYRSEGYDPDNGDWYWAKYTPDGRIARMNNMAVAGRIQMCIQCHSGAEGNDHVFANDRN